MAVSKSRALELAERRREVLRLYRTGMKQSDIAKELGLEGKAGEMAVSRDLAAVKEEWKASAVRDYDTEKGRILSELDGLKKETLAAWERSKANRTSVRERKLLARKVKALCGPAADDGAGEMEPERVEREQQVETRDGDPRFLHFALDCIAKEAELLGLVAKAGEPGTSPPIVAFKICGPDDRPAVTGAVIPQGAAPAARLPVGLKELPPPGAVVKELPPGADPDEWEKVEDDDGLAKEGEDH